MKLNLRCRRPKTDRPGITIEHQCFQAKVQGTWLAGKHAHFLKFIVESKKTLPHAAMLTCNTILFLRDVKLGDTRLHRIMLMFLHILHILD